MPFLPHKPLCSRLTTCFALVCLLLLAAPLLCAAQASTSKPNVVTNYQAITQQPGTSPKQILHGLGLVLTVGLTFLSGSLRDKNVAPTVDRVGMPSDGDV